MRQGVLIYDHDTDRMDIRFDLDDYYGGLHCGTSMEVFVNNKWVPTRIEINDQWYLVGIKTGNLIGLRVCILFGIISFRVMQLISKEIIELPNRL